MRRAILVCTAELLREGLGPLFDAGLRIAGSFESRSMQDMDTVVLGIEGDALPEECGPSLNPLREVSVEFTSEAYGRQRLVRVSAIKLTGRNVFDIVRLPPDAGLNASDADVICALLRRILDK